MLIKKLSESEKLEIAKSDKDYIAEQNKIETLNQLAIVESAKLKVKEVVKKEREQLRIQKRSDETQAFFYDDDFRNWNVVTNMYNTLKDDNEDELTRYTPCKCILHVLCRASIEAQEHFTIRQKRMSGAMFAWLTVNGARFYTNLGELVMLYNRKLYFFDKKTADARRRISTLLYTLSGNITSGNSEGSNILEYLACMGSLSAPKVEMKPLISANVDKGEIYFNMNNSQGEVLKILPETIEKFHNGKNDMLFVENSKFKKFNYKPDVNIPETEEFLKNFFRNNLSCRPEHADFIRNWLCAFLFADYVSTRPILRLEGCAGSGKTTALKIMTTLLYGEEQQKKATSAANYSDASGNPLIALDQIETVNASNALTDFLLTTATGLVKEKRKHGSDTEIISERIKCLVCSSGIEPLRGELTEISSRSFVITFSMPTGYMVERNVLKEIRDKRDDILSLIVLKSSRVLKLLKSDMQEIVMRMIPNHSKKRCNEYLSLMYLVDNCFNQEKLVDLDEDFSKALYNFTEDSEKKNMESNYTVTLLLRAFYEANSYAENGDDEEFFKRYTCRPTTDKNGDMYFDNFYSQELFIFLGLIAKWNALKFPYKNNNQFAQRFANDVNARVFERAFIDIKVSVKRRRKVYKITYKESLMEKIKNV